MKILNLYAGIGGNRKLWPSDVEVTAIEIDKGIAKCYKTNFPQDIVIEEDAHEYLLEHFKEFDFIWASPPCPTHSRIRKLYVDKGQNKPLYPDMKLYEEILLLKHYFKGKWVIENVIAFYEPLIKPQEVQRHHFWSNFIISKIKLDSDNIQNGSIEEWEKRFGLYVGGFDLEKIKVLRNCVHPKLGLHIFNCAFKVKQQTLAVINE